MKCYENPGLLKFIGEIKNMPSIGKALEEENFALLGTESGFIFIYKQVPESGPPVYQCHYCGQTDDARNTFETYKQIIRKGDIEFRATCINVKVCGAI